MAWIRAYIDKANGEHSRIVDLELSEKEVERGVGPGSPTIAGLSDAGRKALKLKKGETAEHFAELTFGADQANG